VKEEVAQILKVAGGTTTTAGLMISDIQAYVGIAVGLVTLVYTCLLIYDKRIKMNWEKKVREKQMEILKSQE